jgi:hypothetical protein
MSSSLNNTQAMLFTSIPSEIRKSWNTEIRDAKTSSKVETPARKHEESLIERIELIVTYRSDLIAIDPENLDTESDNQYGFIDAWHEARKDWIALENSINSQISDFIKRAQDRCDKKIGGTLDSLTKTKTIMIPVNHSSPAQVQNTIRSPSVRFDRGSASTVISGITDRTIVPDNSASVIGREDLERYIRNTIKSNIKHSGKSRSSTASRIMSYTNS